MSAAFDDLELNVNQPLLRQDPSAQSLVDELARRSADWKLEGAVLYHNFPLYRDSDETSSRVNVLVISPQHGVLVFQATSVVPARDSEVADELIRDADEVDQSASHIFARLIRSAHLRNGPQSLRYPMREFIYVPGAAANQRFVVPDRDYIHVVSTDSSLGAALEEARLPEPIDEAHVDEIVAVLEGSAGLVSPRERKLDPSVENSRGRVLREIEIQIANFDREQKRAAMNIIDGPQRIRGLAGSGKTIVLTWKAALIHLQNPDARILYTFYTKSLYDLIKNFITKFYRHYAERDPNWDNLQILHAWGGQRLPGVYSNACAEHGVPPLTFNDARSRARSARVEPFDYVCEDLLQSELRPIYDYAILDEGQDFPASFYRLCLALTKRSRVIWGYDECQNILEIDLQDPKTTFGNDDFGQPRVDLDNAPSGTQNDIVLHRCYRNPRHILTYAFALGLGLYNERVLQLPENNEHWADLGFTVLSGSSQEGDQMVVERPPENSPLVTNQLFSGAPKIEIKKFSNPHDEVAYVVRSILRDVELELLPEDILVVSLDDRYAREYFTEIEELLLHSRVPSFNVLDAPVNSQQFHREGRVTLSTVYRAKGNESGSVYVVGVDSVFAERNAIAKRNRLFTAMTRTKGWLTITGTGDEVDYLIQEYERVERDYPQLKFRVPDRRTLKTFQRDLNEQQAQLNLVERELERRAEEMGVSSDRLLEILAARKKNGK